MEHLISWRRSGLLLARGSGSMFFRIVQFLHGLSATNSNSVRAGRCSAPLEYVVNHYRIFDGIHKIQPISCAQPRHMYERSASAAFRRILGLPPNRHTVGIESLKSRLYYDETAPPPAGIAQFPRRKLHKCYPELVFSSWRNSLPPHAARIHLRSHKSANCSCLWT